MLIETDACLKVRMPPVRNINLLKEYQPKMNDTFINYIKGGFSLLLNTKKNCCD